MLTPPSIIPADSISQASRISRLTSGPQDLLSPAAAVKRKSSNVSSRSVALKAGSVVAEPCDQLFDSMMDEAIASVAGDVMGEVLETSVKQIKKPRCVLVY